MSFASRFVLLSAVFLLVDDFYTEVLGFGVQYYLGTTPRRMYRSFFVLLPMMLFLMNRRIRSRSSGRVWGAPSWATAASCGVRVMVSSGPGGRGGFYREESKGGSREERRRGPGKTAISYGESTQDRWKTGSRVRSRLGAG
ncbi:hypothetical protein B0O80DRAFT_139033 [Mortierella sp. GBAus27b]|nr:hypothetical protein B0O80DRAFT_139033 [Mortierella sp. GBAus27b]